MDMRVLYPPAVRGRISIKSSKSVKKGTGDKWIGCKEL